MSGMTLVVGAIVVGLLVGAALVPGAPIFALPIVALLIVVLGAAEMRRRGAEARSMASHREQAGAEQVDFTARDKQTLVESADPNA